MSLSNRFSRFFFHYPLLSSRWCWQASSMCCVSFTKSGPTEVGLVRAFLLIQKLAKDNPVAFTWKPAIEPTVRPGCADALRHLFRNKHTLGFFLQVPAGESIWVIAQVGNPRPSVRSSASTKNDSPTFSDLRTSCSLAAQKGLTTPGPASGIAGAGTIRWAS